MDEVFGANNIVVTIVFKKKGATTPTATVNDYLLWYAKDRDNLKIVPLIDERSEPEDDPKFNTLIAPSGEHHRVAGLDKESLSRLESQGAQWARVNYPVVSQQRQESRSIDYMFQGNTKKCGENRHWSFEVPDGLDRLAKSERLFDAGGASLGGIVYWTDRRSMPISNIWVDTKGEEDPVYAVQTAWKVVQRCVLMTTDPGDLVLDPTCGSGTTAYVAEQWGRRWITIDTSRVALTLAKHRLMTARFDYYRLRALSAEDVARNPNGTWIEGTDGNGGPNGARLTLDCRTVPHVTLRSIARNTSLDPIFARHEPLLAAALAALNRALAAVTAETRRKLVEKLIAKHRRDGANAVTDADVRRWLLPDTPGDRLRPVGARRPLKAVTARQAARYRDRIPAGEWRAWQAPFDADPDWPQPLQEALAAYRAAWRAKMEEVNAGIAANADVEELVDQPAVVKGTVRVAGPFTMEGVIALEEGPDSPIGGAPEELDDFGAEDGAAAVANAEAHLDKMIRLLKASGVQFPGNKHQRFERLDPITGPALIHAEGEWLNGAGAARTVAVSVGPEAGNVTTWQVEEVVRAANRAGYDDVVFAGFGFDAAAQAAIEHAAHPHLRLHMALISPDAAMADLLKTQPGSQIFTVFSAPRVAGPARREDGDYEVEVEGMDVYDPVSNTLAPTESARIAAWFLDTDYDGRTFCICQAFFPDKSKWRRLAKALGSAGVVDEAAFDDLSGLRSLPFAPPPDRRTGEPWRIAVKVIDPRGNEGLRVLTVEAPA